MAHWKKKDEKRSTEDLSVFDTVDRIITLDLQIGAMVFPILCCEVDVLEDQSPILTFAFYIFIFFTILTALALIPLCTKILYSKKHEVSQDSNKNAESTVGNQEEQAEIIPTADLMLGAKIFLFDISAAIGFTSGCAIQRFLFSSFYGNNAVNLMTAGLTLGFVWMLTASRLAQFYFCSTSKPKTLKTVKEDALSLLSKAKQWYNISYVSLICLGGGLLIYIIMYIRVAGNSLHFLASVIVWAFIICLKANTIMAISKIIVNLGNLAKDVGEAKA